MNDFDILCLFVILICILLWMRRVDQEIDELKRKAEGAMTQTTPPHTRGEP